MAITNITGPKETVDNFVSVWNAAHLPILYKITNNLFPNNQVDAPAVSNNGSTNDNGNLRISYFEAKFQKGEYVTIYDSTLPEYNRPRVRVINAVEVIPNFLYTFTFDLPYLGNGVFKIIKYYNNYHYRVKLLAGLAPNHVLAAQKPMQLIAERKVDVINNQHDVFVDSLVASDEVIKFKNNTLANANDFNDIDAWNQFYIQTKEMYDGAVTNYIVDGSCADEPKQTEFFSTFNADLDGWVNISIGGWPFEWSGGKVCFTTDGTIIGSDLFKKDFSFLQNKSYFLSLDWTVLNTLISNGTILIYLGTGTNYVEKLIYQQNFTDDVSLSEIEFIPDKDYDFITIRLSLGLNGQFNTACLDNIKLETISEGEQQDCTNYYAGVNSALQFQNDNAGNMAAYVVNDQYEAKFLTDFPEPVYFRNYPFDLSIIIPDKAAYKTRVTTYNAQGQVIAATEYNITAQDEGLYRLKNFLAAVTDATAYMEVYVKKGEVKVSETLKIKVDQQACPYPFYVTWLNTLGGWNYFLFKGAKSYGMRTENTVVTESDVYTGWPNNYKNGTTVRDVKAKTSDRTLVLRSQVFDEDNIEAVMGIAESVDVYHINGNKMRKIIIPPVSNENIHKDGQGLYSFNTDAYYTDSVAIQKK